MQVGLEQQAELWQHSAKANAYNALCNAFYVREIGRLSQDDCANVQLLKRRFASLPFYIEKAASQILSGNNPLELDTQNGSWIGKQARSTPKTEFDTLRQFYTKYAAVGLIIPVLVYDGESATVRIDSIDELSDSGFHCNQFGWASYSGQSQETQKIQVLKLGKGVFSAACCGHVWIGQRKASPRLLTLREMLLAARINWQNFKKPF